MVRSICVCSVAQSCLTLFNTIGLCPSRLLCPWNFPGKNIGVGCHFLLQGIFLPQGLNPHLVHCRQILYHWTTGGANKPLYVKNVSSQVKYRHFLSFGEAQNWMLAYYCTGELEWSVVRLLQLLLIVSIYIF